MRSPAEMRDLILLSIDMLRTMLLPSSLFCYERIRGQDQPRGVSVRYTLIALLGLIKARSAGYGIALDIDGIWKAALSELGSANTTLGDIGLYMWVDSWLGAENSSGLLQRLESCSAATDGLASCVGAEIGWAIAGTVSQAKKTGSSTAVKILKELVQSICNECMAENDLVYHFRASGPRRRFPNFANQIYNIYALSSSAEFLEDDLLLAAARRIADRLLTLQLPCGGWPWLYDAQRGTVMERYEIYSVHQDGMAPMSLLKLSELTGEKKYARAAFAGLDWVYAKNELSLNMINEKECLIYRSIRRRKPYDRLMKAVNAGFSILGLPGDVAKGRFLEVNPTTRPYHPGWILYAWSGRENYVL